MFDILLIPQNEFIILPRNLCNLLPMRTNVINMQRNLLFSRRLPNTTSSATVKNKEGEVD